MKPNHLFLFTSLSSLVLLLQGCGNSRSFQGNPLSVESSAVTAAPESIGVSIGSASVSDCLFGGSVMTFFKDSNLNGVLDTEESIITSSSVCNGATGANGSDAVFKTGAVGKEVAGKSFSSCHHDFLFVPDSQNPERSWLLFRHQKNGSADQGIGSTGFNVWNVDIENFSLASETGSVTYCKLHWDPQTLSLKYEVIDNSDGHAGETDVIQMM